MGRVSWGSDAVRRGSATLRHLWSFLPESFSTEGFALTQGGRHTPLCEGVWVETGEQPAALGELGLM